MEAQSLVSHQHSWWFSCFSLREKLARSHNKKTRPESSFPNNYFTVAVLVITSTAFFTAMSCLSISGESKLRTCATSIL